nr:MAG TPA: hypothetical protein [Caudoviricetes sp.]
MALETDTCGNASKTLYIYTIFSRAHICTHVLYYAIYYIFIKLVIFLFLLFPIA